MSHSASWIARNTRVTRRTMTEYSKKLKMAKERKEQILDENKHKPVGERIYVSDINDVVEYHKDENGHSVKDEPIGIRQVFLGMKTYVYFNLVDLYNAEVKTGINQERIEQKERIERTTETLRENATKRKEAGESKEVKNEEEAFSELQATLQENNLTPNDLLELINATSNHFKEMPIVASSESKTYYQKPVSAQKVELADEEEGSDKPEIELSEDKVNEIWNETEDKVEAANQLIAGGIGDPQTAISILDDVDSLTVVNAFLSAIRRGEEDDDGTNLE